MRLCLIGKYPPIQGGVSRSNFWAAQELADRGVGMHVVTNAQEVEDAFRMVDLDAWMPDPAARRPTGPGVLVHQTSSARDDSYIPWANPYVTKLSTLATEVVQRHGCDLIYGHYFEPYGMAAYLTAQWTGVPYGLGHAGSDVGRLIQSPRLHTAYVEIIRRADFIVASPSTQPSFRALGVSSGQLYNGVSLGVPEQCFHPAVVPWNITDLLDILRKRLPPSYLGRTIQRFLKNQFDPALPSIGIYGKVGETKGTFDLITALGRLRDEGRGFNFLAMTQGSATAMQSLLKSVEGARIAECTWLLPFVPHWRLAGFIRSCTAVCFLERDFPIAIHGPLVPAEVLACGTCLVLSPEILHKQYNMAAYQSGVNVLIADPRQTESLVDALRVVVSNPVRTNQIGARGYAELYRHHGDIGARGRELAKLFHAVHETTVSRRRAVTAAELQAALGRLCLDGSFRRLLDLEPDATLSDYDLDDNERTALQSIDGKLLSMFADSLQAKRLERWRDAYPLTFKHFRLDVLRRYYERFHQLHPPTGHETDLEALAQFGWFLEESLASDPCAAEYAADVVRYERLYLTATLSVAEGEGFPTINAPEGLAQPPPLAVGSAPRLSSGTVLGTFRYDMAALFDALEAEVLDASLYRTDCYLVFRRLPHTPLPAVFRLSAPMHYLLSLCDGRLTVERLINLCIEHFDSDELGGRIQAALTKLLTNRVLCV